MDALAETNGSAGFSGSSRVLQWPTTTNIAREHAFLDCNLNSLTYLLDLLEHCKNDGQVEPAVDHAFV